MKATLRDGVVLTGVKEIVVYREYGRIKFDDCNHAACTPVLIEAETIVGFMALEELLPAFAHMKCVKDNNFEDCGHCHVRMSENGPCGIIGIKEAAEKERKTTGG